MTHEHELCPYRLLYGYQEALRVTTSPLESLRLQELIQTLKKHIVETQEKEDET